MTNASHGQNDVGDEAFRVIRKHLRFLNAGDPLLPDSSLRELGLTSLTAIDLMLDLEQTFGFVFPDEELTEKTFRSAGGITAAVTRSVQSKRGG